MNYQWFSKPRVGGSSPPGRAIFMYFVYLLISNDKHKHTYVGYTKDLNNRLKLHNSGKGAKFTKGRSWRIIYFRRFNSKSEALKNEYKLKKDYFYRKKIKIQNL